MSMVKGRSGPGRRLDRSSRATSSGLTRLRNDLILEPSA